MQETFNVVTDPETGVHHVLSGDLGKLTPELKALSDRDTRQKHAEVRAKRMARRQAERHTQTPEGEPK
ncbi:hypothetical protein D9M71_768210 [compost metagenome]